jgi:hypothetical protein
MAKFIALHDDDGVTIHANLDLVRLIKHARSEPKTEVIFLNG